MDDSEFCGNETYLDFQQLWNATQPKFPKCFLKTFPFWIPAIFLWSFGVADYYIQLKKRSKDPGLRSKDRIPRNCYNISRLTCVILLILCTFTQLIHDLCYFDWTLNSDFDSDWDPATPADIIASVVNIITFIFFALLTEIHRKNGKHTSGVAWIYTFLSLFSFIPVIYTFMMFGVGSDNAYIKIGLVNSSSRIYLLSALFYLHWFLLSIIFLLTCFADQRPSSHVPEWIPEEDSTPMNNSNQSRLSRTSKQTVSEDLVDSFELNSPYEPSGTTKDCKEKEQNLLNKKQLIQKNECPQLRASFLSRITFWWVNSLAYTGFKRSLKIDDLWELNPKDKTSSIAPRFDQNWQAQLDSAAKHKSKCKSGPDSKAPVITAAVVDPKKQKTAGIVKTLVKTFGWQFLTGAIFKLGHDLLQFVLPQLLKVFIGFVSQPSNEEPLWHGYFIAAMFFLVATLQSLMLNHYFYTMFLIGMRVRTCVISAIYRKALVLSNAARKTTTSGEIVNLMSVDAQRFVDLLPILNLVWSSPLQIMLTIYFLWREMGPSVLAGLLVMILMIPLNGLITSYTRKLQMQQMKKKDERVKVINELLNGIRVIKLYAWEEPFIKKVSSIRNQEIDYLKKIGYFQSATSFIWTCAPSLVALVTFAVYVLSSDENVLDPSKAFVSLALFNFLRFPMSMLPMTIAMMVSVSVSIERLNRYLNSPQLENYVDRDTKLPDDLVVKIEDGTFCWGAEKPDNKDDKDEKKKQQKKQKEEPDRQKSATNENKDDNDAEAKLLGDQKNGPHKVPVVLKSINLQIKKGSLVAIVGHVGSGKSSLLSAILGEMECLNGKVMIDHQSTVAYVSQQAWIQNATLKENILFGQSFDQSRYDSIIEMCALKPDIAMLPGGDETEIGEKGINLSGGQKQRVAIARACYTLSDMVLMDDPLSAVDSHVAKHIFNRIISNKDGFLKGKTRILVTNNISLLPDVDRIVVLSNGSISETGTYQQLMSDSGKFAEFIREFSENEKQDDKDLPPDSMSRSLSVSKGENAATVKTAKTPGEKLIGSEKAETGVVRFSIYLIYFRSLTYIWLAAVIIGFIGMQCALVFSSVWLAIWSDDKVTPANITQQDIELRNHRLTVYGALGFVQAACILMAAIAMANGVVNSSRTLHQSLMKRIMRAPIQFFDTTPLGRIINRFSKDIDSIDSTIPHTLRGWIICFLSVVSTFILIIVKINIFIFVIIPILMFYYLIQRFYVATSRQLKRLESITRSPIYSHFGETLSGVSTIRAYGCAKRFIRESDLRVDTNQRCYFPSFIANRWLAVRLEFCGNMITFFTAAFSVLSRDNFYTQPGFAGLIMTYAMTITQTLNWLIRMTSEMETNVVSVERIEEYCQIPTEREWTRPQNSDPFLAEDWPATGQIDFEEYSVRYREGLELVLDNICINIASGEKIGIVGRTGAGKSTLTLALFRLLEACKGRIVIDDIDISRIGLHELRSKLSIIPQDPVLFSGTIRSNLDPFEINNDQQLWRALEHSHLKEYVSSLESGLEYPVSENGENLSVGQRQLICLARALLRKTKILVLDEATAAIDLETDSLIQNTIRKEFADCTILTIAHRLKTIIDSNRVLVLDKGRVMEFDSPQVLLSDRRSRFYALAKDARLV